MTEEKKLVPAGYYDVKVKSYGCGLSKEKKTPHAWVKFDNGLFWQGYLTEKTIAKTVEQLVVMGFRGANPADLTKDNMLNMNDTVNVSVEHEVRENGTTVAIVQWVNAAYKKKELDPADVKVLGGIDLRAYVKLAKADLGIDDATLTSQSPTFNAEDVPF